MQPQSTIYIPYRTFEFSSDLFSGFQAFIDLRQDQTSDNIIATAVSQLYQTFQKLGLRQLVEKVRTTRFHIHNFDSLNILTSPPNKVFYICDHC